MLLLYFTIAMKNQRYITTILFWILSTVFLYGQPDYCSDTLYLCQYSATVVEGNGEMVGPFIVSADALEVAHEFDGEDLYIQVGEWYFSTYVTIEDLGAGTTCHIPIFFEAYSADFFELPEAHCIDHYYADPTLDYWLSYFVYTKYDFCLGDKITYKLKSPSSNNHAPKSAYHVLNSDRIVQSLGEIVHLDSNSVDIKYTSTGYELMQLLTYNPSGCEFTLNYPVEVRDTAPPALLQLDGSAMPTTFCPGDLIQLKSADDLSLRWEVSNGLVHNGNSISFSLDVPGAYQIRVEDRQQCQCSPPAYYTIQIEEVTPPAVLCTGTLCDGGEVTYYAQTECSEYEWSVENGSVIGGGGLDQDYVTVLWDDASSGSVTLETPACATSKCPAVTTREIPIIDASAPITGPDSICTGSTSQFAVPDYNGTTFEWNVSQGGYIVSGKYQHQMTIQWQNSNQRDEAVVSVSYDNCDINCQGYSEKLVEIQPVFRIALDQEEYCIDGAIGMTNNVGDLVDYSVYTPGGDTLHFLDTDSVSFMPDSVGIYTFLAQNDHDGVCNKVAESQTLVSYYPNPLAEIKGPMAVCKSQTTSYHAELSHPDETVLWEAYDGDLATPLFTSTSRDLDYQWISDGPYQLLVRVYNPVTKCTSESSVFEISTHHEITGRDSACLSESYWYAYNGKPVPSYQWKITPENAGAVVGIEGNEVKILWQFSGNHQISIDQCDKTTVIDIYVEPALEFLYDAPDYLCKYESDTVTFTTNIPAQFLVEQKWYSTIIATDESPTGTVNSGGVYDMEGTTALGCRGEDDFDVERKNPPTARIGGQAVVNWCPPGSHTLEVLYYSLNNSYQWFKDGVEIPGATGRYYTTSQFGEYTVLVTNQYGCSAMSPVKLLRRCCQNESADANSGTVDIVDSVITCNERHFKVLPEFQSSTFTWSARRGVYVYYLGTGLEASYVFPSAGVYTIYATGDTLCEEVPIVVCDEPDAAIVCEGGMTQIVIPVVANFKTSQSCNSMTVKFTDNSSIYGSSFGMKYSWNFGDEDSGNANTSTFRNPSHTYDEPGIYYVELTVTHPSGCITKKRKSVTVRELPEIDISTNQVFCLDQHTRFYAIVESGSGLKYSWNFGDPSTGTSNTSTQKNPYHQFSSPGTYFVRLRVRDPNDCVDTKNITVKIVENELLGEIETDKVYPKCPDEEVLLTAPEAPFYKWNNGDSVRTTRVVDEGNYRVTLTDEYGCRHVTDYHFVDDYIFQNVNLFAKDYNHSGGYSIKNDSIEICIGDRFDINASYVPASKYIWNHSGKKGNELTYDDDLSSLGVGRHEFYTTIKEIPNPYKIQIALQKAGYDLGPNGADGHMNVDTEQALEDFQIDNGLTTGLLSDSTLMALDIQPCEVEVGPFVVIVRNTPHVPLVESDLSTNCEGELSTMFVSNVDPNQDYLWSTGVEGIEITAYAAGEYQVTTTDTFGCISSSEAIEIYEVPDVSAWMSGCREVCFPEEICVDLRPEYTYTLIVDGEEQEDQIISAGELAIEGVGEYQLKATSADGCSAISDLLALTKTPDDHALSGTVFYDENENDIFDGTDVLLEGVKVYLIHADTILAETVTDASGYYEFLGFEEYDLRTTIDPTPVDYFVKGAMDSILQYETCVEERLIDFPLISDCRQIPMNVGREVCTGKTLIIDGVEYGEFDTDTLIYKKAINCDSIVYLEVTPYPIPEIGLTTVATCDGEHVGELDIQLISGDSLQFSIDDGSEMYKDTSISGLAKGMHTLYVHTNEGCVYPHEFEILEMPVPQIEVETISSCIDLSEGEASLTVIGQVSLQYSIDQGDTYSDALLYDSLSAGMYTVWVRDSLGCIYEQAFEVTNYEEPEYDLSLNHSCDGEDNGSVSLTMNNDVGTEFRLDEASSWTEELVFENLAEGLYTVFSRSEFGCIDSAHFEIVTIPDPFVDFEITQECEDHTLGNIQVFGDSSLTFSLDGVEFDTTRLFADLEAGTYTVYVQDEHQCIYEYPIVVPLLATPDIVLNPSTTCLDESMGILEVDDQSVIDYVFSMDDSLYTDQLMYEGLSAGQYLLYAQNEIGCVYTYDFEIEETLPPVVSLSQDDSCPNEDTGLILAHTSSTNDVIYINDGNGSWDREFGDLPPGTYSILVEDSLGCQTPGEVEILALPPLLVDMPELVAECYEDEVVIQPVVQSHEGEVHYEWSDGSTDDHLIVTNRGDYAVTVYDDCDMTTYSWDLLVRHTATEDHLYASNIFTPNEDGVNDCFRVTVDSDLELIDFHYVIFDRWGNKMFETTDTEDCWDGVYNGLPVEQGVYVVMSRALVMECGGIKRVRKVSDVTVIR